MFHIRPLASEPAQHIVEGHPVQEFTPRVADWRRQAKTFALTAPLCTAAISFSGPEASSNR